MKHSAHRLARLLVLAPILALAACSASGDLSGPAGSAVALGTMIAAPFGGRYTDPSPGPGGRSSTGLYFGDRSSSVPRY